MERNVKRHGLFILVLFFTAMAAGVIPGSAVAATLKPLEVFASILPQAYFVERIGGGHVNVHVLVKPGQEPHTFEPTPKQMVALGKAALFFKVGMPFEERLVEKIRSGRRRMIVVDMGKGIKKRMMAAHDHDHKEEGSHGEADPHIWLSPPLIKIQVHTIAQALLTADPLHTDDYKKNLAAFVKELERTHERIRRVLEPYKGQSFYVFHPAFGYFGDAYGLEQVAVEMEGKSPTPRQLFTLIRRAKSENVKIIFVQPQFDMESAGAVAEAIGGVVVPMDPMAKDVLMNLENMAAKMIQALKR